ncbi:MAG TPA: right-handed parallel beta-helix repeat-containing protein [Polyangia bacterium]|nr:right-handed parallel beta-helix repeat-containing protein [Polyangia bacterium]
MRAFRALAIRAGVGAAGLLLASCSGAGGAGTGGTTGSAGNTSVGGASGNSGGAGAGGASGEGGSGSGGVPGAGGSATGGSATGGSGGFAGAAGHGGTGGVGGGPGTGGSTATGGAVGSGGTSGTGGGAGAGGAGSAAIYVSPSGSDTNPGTLALPIHTLTKAQSLVRTMNGAMQSDITVYLRGGTYPVTSTLVFSNADSGQNGHYVKYLAYPGEQPLITGGQPITGWTASSGGNGVYMAGGITTPFRQLYVDGVKAVRARTPNLGSNGALAFNRLTGADDTNQNIQVASSEVASWNNFTKVEMHVMIGWGDSTLRLASYTTTGSTAYLKVQSPESTVVFVRPFPHLGGQFGGFTKHCYYFENALEFLDQPGEWYLDEGKGVLSYKPRSGEDMSKAVVVAPMVETIVSIAGASTTSQAGYLWFQGITFAHSTYMRPSQSGFLDAQAGQYNLTATSDNKQTVGRPPAGVSVMNANHVHFERNVFTQMGATGLDFVSGTNNDTIIGNVVTDIAGNGISIGKFTASDTTEYHVPYNPTDKNEICTSDTIKDNYIHNVTTEFQGGTGIAAGYPRQVDIEHNEVAYTNYTGISVGYGWTSSVNAMSNNIINYNNVHHVTQILADGASIYTLSNQQPTSQLEYNYLHDYSTSPWADYGDQGIYLDEQTSGYTVAHNAMVNAPTNVAQNDTGTNTITDNPASNASSVTSMAGIEASYADIKTTTIPVPSF